MKVTYEHVDRFIQRVTEFCKDKNFVGVYGPARGGLPFAVWLSHRAKLPMLMSPCKGCLIVDDIADTGKTLEKYAGVIGDKYADKYTICTMFYHRDCSFEPDLWMYEKGKEWIVFPWEE